MGITRIHAYKKRHRVFAARAKKRHRDKNGGKPIPEARGLDPAALYGPDGERCVKAHHKAPIEEPQPDSATRLDEMAMVCASCHLLIHSKKPCLSVAEVRKAPQVWWPLWDSNPHGRCPRHFKCLPSTSFGKRPSVFMPP